MGRVWIEGEVIVFHELCALGFAGFCWCFSGAHYAEEGVQDFYHAFWGCLLHGV